MREDLRFSCYLLLAVDEASHAYFSHYDAFLGDLRFARIALP